MLLTPINKDINKVTISVPIICPISLAIVSKAEAIINLSLLTAPMAAILLSFENKPKSITIKTNTATNTHEELLKLINKSNDTPIVTEKHPRAANNSGL